MRPYSKLIVDLDGTLYCGPDPVCGAVEAMERLRSTCSILFLSNNGNHAPERLARRLRGMGFEAHADEVVCSLNLIVEAVSEIGDRLSVLVISTGDLAGALEEAGHRIVKDARADVVAVGVDLDLGYETITRALKSLLSGATLVGANADATYPTEHGPRPAAGTFVGAMRGMGFTPARMCGKPDPWAMRKAFELRGFQPDSECLLIGDRVDSDIQGAQMMGIDSALVLSGLTGRCEATVVEPLPTYVFESISAIADVLGVHDEEGTGAWAGERASCGGTGSED